MANGFTNLPTSLLGAVSIGGALSVGGGLTVGASPNIVRVGNFTGLGGGISANVALDGTTRDNTGVTGAVLALGSNNNNEKYRLVNAAGNAMDQADASMLAVDHAIHVNTGNVVETTIVSKTIRANRMGAHGGVLVDIVVKKTASVAGGDTFRVKFGGTELFNINLGAPSTWIFRLHLFNAAATNVQSLYGYWVQVGATTINVVAGSSAIDTTADAVLSVTIANGNVGNSNQVEKFAVLNSNSFGPV